MYSEAKYVEKIRTQDSLPCLVQRRKGILKEKRGILIRYFVRLPKRSRGEGRGNNPLLVWFTKGGEEF